MAKTTTDARRYWLVKTEPDCFSWDDLWASPKRTTYWDGVRNYQARNTLRDEMKRGDRVLVLTHLDDRQSGAIALFAVEGLEVEKLYGWLLHTHRIVTTPIVHPEFQGLRITPNVYTTLDELDRFAETVLAAVRKGIA